MKNLLFALFIFATACSESPEEGQTFYLFRHAEKVQTDETQDPPLLPEGRERAEKIAELLENVAPDRYYSTRYIRNISTLRPSAEEHGKKIKIYEWHDWQPMLNEITANQYNLKNVVICGHGDNLLPMIEALGCKAPLDSLGAHEYDKYFVVKVRSGECTVETEVY